MSLEKLSTMQLKQRIIYLQAELKQCREKIHRYQENYHYRQLDELKEANEVLTLKYEELKETYDQISIGKKELQQKVDVLQSQKEEWEEKKKEQSEKLEDYLKEKTRWEEEKNDLLLAKVKIQELTDDNSLLKEELKKNGEEITQLKEDVTAAKRELSNKDRTQQNPFLQFDKSVDGGKQQSRKPFPISPPERKTMPSGQPASREGEKKEDDEKDWYRKRRQK